MGGGGTKWSLGPTRRLLATLGDPHREFGCIHIGGTNGKGSVVAMVAEVLERDGRRVGRYTSPHFVDVRERIVVAGRPIGREAFAQWTECLRPAIEETGASFFEATTAIAFADFAARGVDLAVVEVGLGGRLDSTNVLTPLAAAVTNVARDHTEYLGNDLEDIAGEKAGIAKAGVPFVIGERQPQLVAVLEARAARAGAKVIVVPPEVEYAGPLGLSGRHQRRNGAVARAVLTNLPRELRPDAVTIEDGLARAWLPGRFDRRGKWLFDAAHNPAGMEVLAATVREVEPPGPIHTLFGALGDKDAPVMLERLSAISDGVWVTVPPTAPLARRADPRAGVPATGVPIHVQPDFDVALGRVQEGAATVIVTGSFHTVGDVMSRLPAFQPFG